MGNSIDFPVGPSRSAKADNFPDDVKLVQKLLNRHAESVGYKKVRVSGDLDKSTENAIKTFQMKVLDYKGIRVIGTNGKTIKALLSKPLKSFNPASASFSNRIAALEKDAQASFRVKISYQSKTRAPSVQQKWHVAHMFLYNATRHKPKKTASDGRTICFKYLADASTVWKYVKRDDFLRTKNNKIPKLKRGNWLPGFEPDKEKTIANASKILLSAKVARKSQVAGGYSKCGSPCGCSIGQSKHIAGEAVDLKAASWKSLSAAVKKGGYKSLDQYLAKFGLHRNVPNEPWHVEAK